jgi:UDP-glucose 4-epimerase
MPLDREGLGKLTGNAWFSSDRICTELDFRPRHSLEQDIPIEVRAYLEGGR